MVAKRTWIDFSNPVIDVPQLDSSNLPVIDHSEDPVPVLKDRPIPEVPIPTEKPYQFPMNWNNQYQEASLKTKKLIGQGQPVWDEESMAAEVQPLAGKFASGLISRGSSLIPKIGENIGHIAGAVGYGMDYITDPATADPNQIWDNSLVNASVKMDKDLRESLPIFKSHLGREGNLLEQMKDPGFWFDDLFDSLAFMGSAYVTGMGLGAASRGLGLARILAGESALPEAVKLMEQKIQTYGATVLNSVGEAGFESKDFNDTQRQAVAMKDYGKPFEMLDPDQQLKIKTDVAAGSADVFKGNLGVLIVPNYIQSKYMFGKIGQVASEMRQAVRAGTLMSKDISLWGEAMKGIAEASISEGPWEEGMQNALQTYNTRKENFGKTVDDYSLGVLNEWVDNLGTVQGQKNMVLGSLVGSIFGGLGGARQAAEKRGQVSEEEDIYEKLKNHMSLYDKWYIEHIGVPYRKFKSTIQEQGDDGKMVDREVESYLNKDGKTEIDIDKVERMFLYTLHNKLLFDEGMAATVNADNIHLKTVNADALAKLYFNYATNPGMSNLDEVDDLIMNRELSIPKELADKGYKNRFTRADLKPLRDAFEKSANQLMDASDFSASDSRKAFKGLAVKTLFGEEIKRNMYNDYLATDNLSDKQKEDIRKLIKDSERLTNKLLEKKTREQLYGDYMSEMNMLYDAKYKYDQLQKDPNATEADKARALYEQKEFFDINGVKDPFSTAFPADVMNAPSLSNEFGTRMGYFHNLGRSYWKKATTNKALEDAIKGRKPILDVVNTVVKDIESGTEYSSEELKKLENVINQRQGYLQRTASEVVKRQQQIEDNTNNLAEDILDDEGIPTGDKIPAPQERVDQLNKDIQRDQRWLDNRETLRLDHERSSVTFQDLLTNLPTKEDKTILRDQKKTYRKFQREFADKPVERTEDIMKSYNGNKSAYDNLGEIDETLSELEDRKKIFSMPGRKKLSTTNEFKGFLDSIDNAIKELKTIREPVSANKENRKIIDLKSRINYSTSLFNAIGIKVNRDTKSHTTSNESIFNMVAKIIGPEVLNGILEEAKTGERDGIDYSYDAIYVEKILNLVKKNKEGQKELQVLLDNIVKGNPESPGLLSKFIDTYNSLEAKKGQPKGSQMDLNYYKKNPESVFYNMLDIIINRYLNPISKVSVIDEFLRDQDVFKLYDAIQKGSDIGYKTIIKTELLSLLDAHISILGIDKLRQRLESKITTNEMIETENAVLRSEKLAPSNQQHIALREAVQQVTIALSNKESIKPFKGWSYLKGLAGTGKTTIFAKWLMKLLKYGPESIIGLSTHPNALEVLKEQLPGVVTSLVEGFNIDVLKDEKVRILMVDEVGRMTLTELQELAESVAMVNKDRKNPLRVYVFGDPSQVTNKDVDFAAITNYYEDRINLRHLNPLTSVFRSGNSAIIRAQNVFLDMPGKVKTFLGIASDKLGSPADGVQISNIKADLKNQLLIHSGNTRSKVIVVSNAQDAAYYSNMGAPVMQYYEVAGLQFDEVYIDIDPKDFTEYKKSEDRKFNEAMYTATSRSKNYIFIKSYETGDNWKYRVDKISKEDNSERNKEVLTTFSNRLAFEADVLGMDVKEMASNAPQILQPVEEDENKTATPQTENEPAADEPFSTVNVPVSQGTFSESREDDSVHELMFPSLNKDSQYDNKPYIREGSKVRYIKVWNADKKIPEIWVIGQHINNDGSPLEGNTWEQIGVIGNQEILGLDSILRNALINNSELSKIGDKHITLNLSQGKEGILKEGKRELKEGDTSKAILYEGVIKKASPISYDYSDTITDQGVGFLRNLISKVKGIFSTPTEEDLTFTIEMFSHSDPEIAQGIKLSAGVPYLIIRRKTRKGEETFGRKTQFVRLAARMLKITDPIIAKKNSLLDFSKTITELERPENGVGKLSDPKVNEFLKRFSRNFEVGEVDGKPATVSSLNNKYDYTEYQKEQKERGYPILSEEQFNKVVELSKVFIPGFYGPGEKRVDIPNQYMMEEYLGEAELTNADYTYEFRPHKIKEGGYILRKSKTDPNKTEYVTEEGLQAGKGRAQIGLNILGKANHKQPWVIKKKISIWKSGKQRDIYVTQAKHLLSEHTSSTTYYQHLLAIYKAIQDEVGEAGFEAYDITHFLKEGSKRLTDEENIKTIEDLLIQMKDDKQTNVQGISAEEFQALRKEHEVGTITSKTLADILTFGADGSHAEFNLPLMMNGPLGLNELGKDINQNINQLEELLGSKLNSINKTRVQVQLSKEQTSKNIPYEGKKTAVGDIVHKIISKAESRKKGRLMKYNSKTDLGREISFAEARKLLAKFVPEITTQDKDVLKFMDDVLLQELAGEKAFGLYKDEVVYAMKKGTTTFTKIIRHEAFHKIFTEYLTKNEQSRIIDAFKKQFPEHAEKSFDQIEELLAETFQDYQTKKLTKVNTILQKFFNWLAKRLGFINMNTDNLDRFFETIESGYFVATKNTGIGVTSAMKDIVKIYGYGTKSFSHALDIYRNARAIIQDEFYDLQTNGYIDDKGSPWPITRREIRSIAKQNLTNDYLIRIKQRDELKKSGHGYTEDQVLTINEEHAYYKAVVDNYDRIVKDIYQNWNFDVPGEITVDTDLSTEEILEIYKEKEDQGQASVKDHIIESDEVNQESKMSMAVKDFLSNIKLYNGKFMNWREAYIRTLQMTEGLQPESSEFMQQLSDAWTNNGKEPRSGAILQYLKTLYEDITRVNYGLNGTNIPSTMKFINEDIFVFSNNDVSDINGSIGAEQAGAESVHRMTDESTREFIIRIAKENELDIDDIAGHFEKYLHLNTYRSLINLFNNQKQKNLFIVEKEWIGAGTYSISYIPGSYIGSHLGMASQLRANMIDRFPDKKVLDSWIKTWLEPKQALYINKKSSNKLEFIRSFLKEMKMGQLANNIPNINVDEVYQNITGFFKRASHDMGTVIATNEQDASQEGEEIVSLNTTMADILGPKKETKMINGLARLISISSANMRATSVRDVVNKRKYIWSPSSFAHNVLFNLINNSNYKGGRITLGIPGYLRSDYFKHNIFLSGQNKIHDIVDHDGIRSINFKDTLRGIKQTRENTQDYIVRTFVAGFLDRIRYSSEGKETYFQFFYPNERANAFGTEINILTLNEVRQSLGNALRQINEAPQLSGVEINNKNKFINLRLLENVIGKRNLTTKPLSAKEIDKVSEKIMDQLSIEARRATKTIVDNRVPFDADMFKLSGIQRILGEDIDMKQFKNSSLYGKSTLKSITNQEYNITEDQIYPLVYAYVANNYINSYFINQLILGDYNQFKNEEDVMRRFSLATAPGFKPLVNKLFGIPEKVKFLVIGDQFKETADIEDRLRYILTKEEQDKLPFLMEGFKDNFALGDGQGFMLPERYEQLRNSGFASEFSLHKVVKPVVYSIGEDGVTRGIKYSSIVLDDALVSEFPSLKILRDNIRKAGAMEAVFKSAVKIGIPESSASYSDMVRDGYIVDPESVKTMTFDVLNDHYRIQLDPRAEIESEIRQPSQLMYLAGVLEQNLGIAKRMYYHMSELERLGSEKFFEQYGTPSKIQRNIVALLHGKGNERAYDILSSGLSINFPSISDKVIIQLASHLEKLLVDIKFPGTKLVLQSEYAVRKYHQTVDQGPSGKLRYIRTKEGRLVAEVILPQGLLPKEYEDRIKLSLADKKNANDYFDMPDLLGFRIPSSDIHSGIAMKVVGFYTTPDVNVIIAPDLLVALHGSDFDVDSLFVIKRSNDSKGNLAGYEKKHGKMTFIKDPNYWTDKWDSIEDTIAFRKNGILHELLDLISNQQNVTTMLSPIPLRAIQEQKERVLDPDYHPQKNRLDLSNYNDQISSQETIFGASVATGIFGNAAKGLAYMLRTGKNDSMPTLRDEKNTIFIDGNPYNTLHVFDDTDQSLFVSIDGFINASIDNIRELALPVLNINLKTIKGFIALRALGVPLSIVVDILQQPAILEYSRKNNYDVVQNMIQLRLGGTSHEDLDQSEITEQNLATGIKQGTGIDDMMVANNEVTGEFDPTAYRNLIFQSKILSEFKRMNGLGESIGSLAIWLKIARSIPTEMSDIEKSLNSADNIFKTIEDDGTLSDFENSAFPFDISNFFKKNPHILQAYKSVKKFSELIRSSIKKHDIEFEKLIDKVSGMIGTMNLTKEEARNHIRNEIITYLLSNEIYSGEYKLDKNVTFNYEYGKEQRVLTGPKAMNQIFIGKIEALKNYLSDRNDSEGFPMTNMFLSYLHSKYNGITKTYELVFDGGPNMDPMDMLDIRKAFYDLNRYEVKWSNKTKKYTVKENKDARADNDYSEFQKEFVSYGIMNWGLKFGSSNYSMVLPEDMYHSADILFNNLMDKFIGPESEENWKRIEDDFMIQFMINNGNLMEDIYFKEGLPIDSGIRYENEYGKSRTFYGGLTKDFFYDRAYNNPDKKDFKKYVITKYENRRTVYMRMNEANAETVFYQRIDMVSPFKFYNTSDEVLKGGYKAEDYFQKDKYYKAPVFNIAVSDLNKNTFTYYGNDIEGGDVVTFTLHHDVTRINKAYKRVISKRGDTYIVEPIIPVKTKQAYQKYISTADSIITYVKKQVLKKGTPFRTDNKGRGRILYAKFQLAEAREFKNKMNAEQYDGYRIWRERQWPDGVEMYLDRDELDRFFARGTDIKLSQFFASNKIGEETQKIIADAKEDIISRTSEDDILEEKVKEATDIYAKEKDMSSLIDSMIKRSRSKRRSRLLTALRDKILQQDMKLRFGELNTVGLYGRWNLDGSIVVDLINLYEDEGRLDIDKIDRIIFHEMIHGITKLGMLEIKNFATDIISLINDHFKIDPESGKLLARPNTSNIIEKYLRENQYDPSVTEKFFETFYGLNDVYEFVSEILSNDEFASIMNDVKIASEQKSLLQQILDKILEFLGIKEFAYDFLQMILNSPYTPSFTKEGEYFRSSTGKLYGDLGQSFEIDVEPAVATNVDEVRKAVMERSKDIRKRSEMLSVDKDEKGNELNTYSKVGTNKKYKRITDRIGGFLSYFTDVKYDPNISFGQHMADMRWGSLSHDHEIETDQGNMENYTEYKDRMEKQSRQGMIKGSIMHLMFMRIANRIFKLGYDENEIVKKINNVASLSEGVTKPEHYAWLEDPNIITKIFDQAGINALKTKKDFPDALRDIIYLPEQTVWSDLLGFGGTIDALVAKASGRWSVIDWKTGRKFGERISTDAMKYGLQDIYITDNQRERAKLQVMLYAFLLKLEYPDMQFENLMTVWIPDRFLAEREDMERFVEVSSYLGMIKSFLSDKTALKNAGLDPKIMETILEKSPRIFDTSEYTTRSGDELFENLKDSAFRPEEEYRRRVMEIQIILNRFIPGGKRKIRIDELPEWDKKRLARLYEEVAIIKSDPSLQLDVYPQGDIGWLTQWLGNYSDVNMGVFQTWVKIRNERWNTYTQKHEQDLLHLNRLVEPIYNDYMKNKIHINRGGINRIGNVNYVELFGWAYKEFDKGGVMQERLKTPTDVEWKKLNKDQQKLLTWLNNKYMSWFVGEKAYLNQQATVMYGKSYSWLDLYNYNRNEDLKMKHYEGWFPKSMKTYEEINYEYGAKILNKAVGEGDIFGANFLGRFSPEKIKEAAKRKLTWFEETQFEMYDDVTMSLPIKYMDNPIVINDRNYTKNLVFMFDRFNKSMLHKQHMDNVYVTGQALKVFLEMKRYGNGQPMFENTIGFLEKKLIGDIQNRSQMMKYTRLPITIGKFNISIDKILEGAIHWTSATIMWLRPLQGTGNALFAKLLTHREAMKGSIASRFLHINGDAIDFTINDNVFADGIYATFTKDAMIGDLKKNKMFLMSRKLNYIPDNYDYATNRRFLLSTRNQAISESSMFKFYSVGEEYVSLTTMVAQMHHLKNPVTGKSLWDSYEVRTDENGVTDVHWIGGTRGYEKAGKGGVSSYAPITELTAHEIAKLKKVHERMQGGYRKEEAANIEIYVMGRAFVQFKRYFLRLLINALGGRRIEVDLGTYKKMDETRIDPATGKPIDVYEWLARTNEGRWRTLANVMLTAMQLGKPDYRWGVLSTEQKQNVVDAILCIGMLGLSYAAYLMLFDDDKDDDTFKKWWKNYMIQNTSQQYNPMEMLRILETASRPVALARASKFTEAFGMMMMSSANLALGNRDAAFTQNGDMKGWNEFMRSIPYVSAWHDFASKMQHGTETEQWWTERMTNKWR
jgi:hypothetical protein